MTKGIVLILIGVVQTVWMTWAIRTDAAANRISVIEAAILKIGNAEPLPKSRLGLAFDRLLQWVGLIFGLLIFALGLLFVWVE